MGDARRQQVMVQQAMIAQHQLAMARHAVTELGPQIAAGPPAKPTGESPGPVLTTFRDAVGKAPELPPAELLAHCLDLLSWNQAMAEFEHKKAMLQSAQQFIEQAERRVQPAILVPR